MGLGQGLKTEQAGLQRNDNRMPATLELPASDYVTRFDRSVPTCRFSAM